MGSRGSALAWDDLKAAQELVWSARRVAILTGAGVSADSGVPTFRSPGGLWGRHRPEELATPQAFARDPETVWEWYEWRRRQVLGCSPNEGHYAIARLLLLREGATLITQNVDGLHRRALDQLASGHTGPGPEAREAAVSDTLELHGNLLRSRCSKCGALSDDSGSPGSSSRAGLPRCGECDGLMRPDVVWFGEALDDGVLARAFEVARAAEVCISAGTSAVVQPAAQLPVLTRESGGTVIEVNPEVTPISQWSHICLRGSAAELLPMILDPAS